MTHDEEYMLQKEAMFFSILGDTEESKSFRRCARRSFASIIWQKG